MKIALYPGTFDPITNGHIDVIGRAAKIFDKVIIAIAANEGKRPYFSLARRIELAKVAFNSYSNIEVMGFANLLVDFAKQQGATVIVRGLRAVADFEYEFQLAGMNRALDPQIETIFMTPDEKTLFISSSFVKEIAKLSGDVSAFVPPHVVTALKDNKD